METVNIFFLNHTIFIWVLKSKKDSETALLERAVFLYIKLSTTMLKILNTRMRVQNDNFSTKNVEKTVDKRKQMCYYMQAFRRDAKRC